MWYNLEKMGHNWVSVREFNLAIEDHCDLCEAVMPPDSKIWHVETRSTESFCCSLKCAKELGVRVADWSRSPRVDAEMSALGIATEEEYIDYFGLRPFLLPDDEVLALRKSLESAVE